MKRLLEEIEPIERLEAAGYMEISDGEFLCGFCTAFDDEEMYCKLNKATVDPEIGCCNKFKSTEGEEDKSDWAARLEEKVKKARRLLRHKTKEGAWSLLSEPTRS